MSTTAIAVFTCDLRLHDNPVLAAATESADQVVPLFVHDVALEETGFATGPRTRFLGECLADLDAQLRKRGAALITRHGDLVAEAARLPAEHGTSRLSPYLHFGCLSALELATDAATRGTVGAEAFVRQLAWRDFHHQVLAAHPEAAHRDYRPRSDAWRDDDQALSAWQEGRTGIPIVDAGCDNWPPKAGCTTAPG